MSDNRDNQNNRDQSRRDRHGFDQSDNDRDAQRDDQRWNSNQDDWGNDWD